MKRARKHIVTSPAAWEVLVSSARSEIAEALRLNGPCSIADVGAAINRPADSLYRHVALLIKAGFVREAGTRRRGRNDERLIDVVADDFHLELAESGGSAENRAVVATARAFLSSMERTVRDSARARQLRFRDDERNVSINFELSWLTPQQFQRVRALIRELKALMDAGKRSRQGRLYQTLAIACPVTRRRGSDRPAAPREQTGKQAGKPKGKGRSGRAQG